MHIHISRPEVNIGVVFESFFTSFFLKQASHRTWNLSDGLDWVASKLQNPASASVPPSMAVLQGF